MLNAVRRTRSSTRRSRRDDAEIPGVARVIDLPAYGDIRGIGYIEAGRFTTFHVTDEPAALSRFLRRQRSIVAAYGPRGRTAELGPGLYVSDNPSYWAGRSVKKWSFLRTLTASQADRLLHSIGTEIHRAHDRGMISKNEYERGARDLRYVQEGHYDLETLVTFADQPYNIRFWQADFLKPLGIRTAQPPRTVRIHIRGRFAELTRSRPGAGLLRTLRRMRLQGAFTRASMSTNPEMVIWDPRAIVSAKEEEDT